ncbi:hypothetical protein L208DRAFT_1547674 [Tricholoma matsutake]|nr:hypothetical protein L208DRAFT_1547674 [Tricholoma matsutake 945]
MYLLGNPDHYTNFDFVPFYWQSFVREARNSWEPKPLDIPKTTNTTDCKYGYQNEEHTQRPSDVSNNINNRDPEDETEKYPEKLTIFKCNGCIIGFSPVHDYLYRPAKFHAMCLYDWISTCQREKLPLRKKKKESAEPVDGDVDKQCNSLHEDIESCINNDTTQMPKTKLLSFLSEHPLAETHGVRYLKTACIPNFIGSTIPRHDQGDHEYYCSTMLTLFKPWRSGLYLKDASDSWDESFMSHKFSAQQLEIMKNMNIQYECLDARDDFHAQMKKGATVMQSWAEPGTQIFDDLDQLVIDDAVNMPSTLDEYVISSTIGKSEQTHTELMTDVRRMLVSLGWTKHNADLLPDKLNLSPDPIELQTPAQWKAAVTKKHAEILEERICHLPANVKAMVASNSFIPNDVRIVDKTYMSRSFFSKEWQQTIDKVSKQFSLNEEQNRAFRIVANHACSPDSDQLKMNTAGMAGTGKSQVLKSLVEFFILKKESHRFIIVAPTGSAAALLQGSTYHSVFGISCDGKHISGVQFRRC